MKHQEAIKRLNTAFAYYGKNLESYGFQKFANKLINNNDIRLHSYHEWEMKKGPEWAEHEDTDFIVEEPEGKGPPPEQEKEKKKKKRNKTPKLPLVHAIIERVKRDELNQVTA